MSGVSPVCLSPRGPVALKRVLSVGNMISVPNSQKRRRADDTGTVTAAALVIGDEILSGRTADTNIVEIARVCTQGGIQLHEVRVIGDNTDEIVATLNALRCRHDYVFTTGGIGPTHDDITADAVARSFGVPLEHREEAAERIRKKFGEKSLTPEGLRMARIPAGAELIDNPVSGAPGFRIENVFVMAGVPVIMQAMLHAVAPSLKGGAMILSRTVSAGVGESVIAGGLKKVQRAYPGVKIGSYPLMGNEKVFTEIVLRSSDPDLLKKATRKVQEMVDESHRERGVVPGGSAGAAKRT